MAKKRTKTQDAAPLARTGRDSTPSPRPEPAAETVAVGAIEEHLVRIEQRIESFSGPLPHPELLRGYQTLGDGYVDQIFEGAEKERAHRHAIELRREARADSALDAQKADAKANNEMMAKYLADEAAATERGQYLGFATSTLFLGAGLAVALVVSPIGGAIIAGGGLSGVAITVGAVVFAKRRSEDKVAKKLLEGTDHE